MLPEESKTDHEIVLYLMNFWEHSIKDTVLSKTSNDINLIRKISKTHPEQIQFFGGKDWHFIQDWHWYPDVEEAMESVCPKIGIQINKFDNTISKNRVFRAIPQTFQELYSSIVEFRIESI